MMLTRLAALPVKHPSAALLSVQVLSILLYPLLQDTPVQRGAFRIIGLLVLLGGSAAAPFIYTLF